MVDFHGSTGYGQAFTDAIRGDWGGKPLEDLQKGLEAALKAHPWMDGERVGALGASYGGYMVNWIAGAWPDRFKAPGLARRQPRRALRLLRDRGALVPRVGARRHAVGEPGRLREAQPDRPREELEDADAGRPRRRSTTASSTPAASRPSPPRSARASPRSCSTSRTRTTGSSSPRTRSSGTTPCSTGWTSG